MASLRVGLTLSRPVDDLPNLLWSQGLNQNAVLLAMLMRRLPDVASVVMIDCSDRPGPHPLATWLGVPTVRSADVPDTLDLVIEIGGRPQPDYLHAFRDRGGKLVSYMAGNAMAMNFEAIARALPHGEHISPVPYDACWLTPQHWHMNRDLCRITRTPNTRVAPHLWEPIFFDAFAREAGVDPSFKRARVADGWRIGVLEPNINALKTFHFPLLVAEEAFRIAPDRITEVLLFNTQHFVGVPHFDDITASTDLFKAKKLFVEGRHATPLALARHVDAVVVHQWQNDLNYLYWDVLWTGHPLIHNSPSAREAGYYYEPFDPSDGGRVMADALGRHAAEAEAYRRTALDLLHRFSINNPAVIAAHDQLIEELYS